MFVFLLKYVLIALAMYVFIEYGPLSTKMSYPENMYFILSVLLVSFVLDNMYFYQNLNLNEAFADFQYERNMPDSVYSDDIVYLKAVDPQAKKTYYMNRSISSNIVVMKDVPATESIRSNLSKLRLHKESSGNDNVSTINYLEPVVLRHNAITDSVGNNMYKNTTYAMGIGSKDKLLSHESVNLATRLMVAEDVENATNNGPLKYDRPFYIRVYSPNPSDPANYLRATPVDQASGVTLGPNELMVSASATKETATPFVLSLREPVTPGSNHLSIRLNEYVF